MDTRYARRVETATSQQVTRRRFLQAVGGSAALVVTWSSVRFGSPVEAAALQQARRTPPRDVDSYLAIGEDGTVTLATGKVEFGQGIQTGFAQLVAEELDVPFERVNVVMGITDQVPYDGATVGSQSTRRTGQVVRQAAAEMRQWLLELGAAELGVSADRLVVPDGTIAVGGDASKTVTYAKLAAGKKAQRQLGENTRLKDPAHHTIVGQEIPRLDLPTKINGEVKYGYDATVEGMVHGKIVRPPALGATLQSIDFSEAEAMPGVVGTFRDGDFAGLAAERRDQADAALAKVKAVWSPVETGNTSANIFDLIKRTADAGEVLDEEPGDPDTALAGLQTISATFRAPYVSHSPIEPKAALVKIDLDRVDVWTSTQLPFGVQQDVAALLNRPLEQVVVTPLMSGGAFGSKSPTVAELEAGRLAQAFGKPVRIQWTRQDEFQFGRFRPAAQVEITAGLAADGNVAGWKYDLYSTGYFPEGAAEPTRCAANLSADAGEIYTLPNAKSTWYQGHSPLSPHFWRANGTSYNTIAREVMLDELAEKAGVDPVTFRARLLGKNPRMKAVMDAVVAKSGWKPGVGSTGQGIGLALAYTDETYVATAAHVTADQTSGQIHVVHVDVAIDCGLVVNPEAARQQIEGSVNFSLSPTLREAITFDNGKVTNDSFGEYRPLTIVDAPTIDVVFVEDKTQPMAGIGEPAVAPVLGAVANAIYDGVGIRLRDLPFTPDSVLAALKAKTNA
jgi:nicotinate dehydrogenase subunit B